MMVLALQLGMGLGGPFGGIITDWYVPSHLIEKHDFIQYLRLGWRWAFLLQGPFFILSFCLTSYYLNYVTPVSASVSQARAYPALMALYLG